MDPIFNAAELAEVHAYSRPYYVWSMFSDAVMIGVSLLILRFGIRPLYRGSARVAQTLDQHLGGLRRFWGVRAIPSALDRMWKGPGWGTALLFAAANVLLVRLIFLPQEVYFDYFHAHAFGQSNYTPGAYVYDLVKGLLLSCVAIGALAFGMYGVARRLPRWWLVLGLVAGTVMLASPFIDPFRGQVWFERERLEEGPLREQITALMDRADVEVRDVVVEKTSRISKEAQAYFAGQGPTRTIVVNDVLAQKFPPEQILAVVAHEAGHVHEPKWLKRVLSSAGLLAFLFVAHQLMRHSARRRWYGVEDYGDVRTLPLITFTLYLVTLVVGPVSLAASRANEEAADLYAMDLTGDPGTYQQMLVTLARTNKADPQPPTHIQWLRMGHPSIQERLEAAERFKKQAASGSGTSPSPNP